MASLSRDAFLAAGVAFYAGEGAKGEGKVHFANTNADMMRFFCQWLRAFFDVDETRVRAKVYLHEGLDLDAAQAFWSDVMTVPLDQFQAPYRAVADPSIRTTKHEMGCAYFTYCCTPTHRQIMGLIRGLLASTSLPG